MAQAKQKKQPARGDALVVEQLQALYSDRLLPIEKKYLFHKFHGKSPRVVEEVHA